MIKCNYLMWKELLKIRVLPKRLPSILNSYLKAGVIETDDECLVSKFFSEKNPHLLIEQYEDRVAKEHTINEIEINNWVESDFLEVSIKYLCELVNMLEQVNTQSEIIVYFFKAESGYIVTWHKKRDDELTWIPISDIDKEKYALMIISVSHLKSRP